MRSKRKKLAVNFVLLLVFSCAAPRPTANAPDLGRGDITLIGIREVSGQPGGDYFESSSTLARNLFLSAVELDNELHQRPIENRTKGDYLRVIDGYAMVNRVDTDERLAGESLWRSANTMREIADTMADYTLYRKAIRVYHQIIDEHPRSNYVGEALLGIAQICEENLQDLKGAAEAYRALIAYFPDSVLARESKAVLSRFQSALLERNGDPDVIMPAGANDSPAAEFRSGADSETTLENIRNYTGPDYCRIVLDLSDGAAFDHKPAQGNQVSINLKGIQLSPSLFGRRFIIRDSRFLKQIVVRSSAPGASQYPASGNVEVQIIASSPGELSAFQLSDPARIVIDLRAGTPSTPGDVEQAPRKSSRSEPSATAPAQSIAKAPSIGSDSRLQERSLGIARATLPEVDVSNLSSLQESLKVGTGKDDKTAATSGQPQGPKTAAADAPTAVRCIVIDPGHGGHDTGTIGAGGLKEKDLVLAVGLRLRDYIRKNFPDVEVVMTRDSDRFIALEERTAIANSKRADLFISIHANAAPSHSASGVETYFLSPGRAASETVRIAEPEQAPATEVRTAPDKQQAKPAVEQSQIAEAKSTVPDDKLKTAAAAVSPAKVTESRELASYIQSGLVRGVGSMAPKTAMNRGVKNAGFVVLLGAAMPSVLAEISFVSNPHDEDLLRTDQFRDRIAVSLFAGLRAYLKKKETAVVKNKKG